MPSPSPYPLALSVLAAWPLLVAWGGAAFGSFLNVVAWRLPRQESLLWPASHCPRCGHGLAWFENLPLLSWLLLRGHCRHCRQPIAPRYFLVELLAAGLAVGMLFARPAAMGSGADPLLLLLAGWLLAGWLLPLSLIDLDSFWLPEPLCRWGVLLGLAVSAGLGFSQGFTSGCSLLLSHLLAAAGGLIALEGLSALGQKLLGRPALGLGDARLAALIGAWLGPTGLALALFLAVSIGALVGTIGLLSGRLGRHQPVPFGPFLALGCLAVWIAGPMPWLELLGLAALTPLPPGS